MMGFLDIFRFRGGGQEQDFKNYVRDSGELFAVGNANVGVNVDEQAAMQIATVYACVRLLAETLASLPLNLYHKTEKYRELADDHPLYYILHDEPNEEMSSFIFWESMMTHLLLWGNAYAQIIRTGRNEIVGLYPLLPERMEVDRDPVTKKIIYTYRNYSDETATVEEGAEMVFRSEEIFHIPALSFNGLVGFSPIGMMKNTLGSAIAVDRYGQDFFAHNAQPIGVLEHPMLLKDPEKLKADWTSTYGGVGNSHRIAVLEEGMQYKPINLPPEDSQFLSTKEFTVEEICRIFRVPPHLVQDLKRSTYSNIEHQGIAFVTYTLGPWMARIERGIKKSLLFGDEKKEYYAKFNADALLRGDYSSRMEGYSKAFVNSIMNVNEIRAKEDLEPLSEEEGGFKHIVNGSYVELKDAGIAYKRKGDATGAQMPGNEEEEQSSEESKDMTEYNENQGEKTEETETEDNSKQKHSKGYTRRKNERRGNENE